MQWSHYLFQYVLELSFIMQLDTCFFNPYKNHSCSVNISYIDIDYVFFLYGSCSSHMLKVCLLEEMTQSWLQPLMKWYWEEMAYKDIEDSSGWIGYILLILSIGMPYYQRGCNTNHRQVSSAQTNRTQVLTWDKHLALHLRLLILGLVLRWIT